MGHCRFKDRRLSRACTALSSASLAAACSSRARQLRPRARVPHPRRTFFLFFFVKREKKKKAYSKRLSRSNALATSTQMRRIGLQRSLPHRFQQRSLHSQRPQESRERMRRAPSLLVRISFSGPRRQRITCLRRPLPVDCFPHGAARAHHRSGGKDTQNDWDARCECVAPLKCVR